jgi:hypothetical protein
VVHGHHPDRDQGRIFNQMLRHFIIELRKMFSRSLFNTSWADNHILSEPWLFTDRRQ